MSRARFHQPAPKVIYKTPMMRLDAAEVDALANPPIDGLARIFIDRNHSPDHFDAVYVRLKYVQLACHNYEEEPYLRCLTTLALEKIQKHFQLVQVDPDAQMPSEHFEEILEALRFGRQLDESLRRLIVIQYYEQAIRETRRLAFWSGGNKQGGSQ